MKNNNQHEADRLLNDIVGEVSNLDPGKAWQSGLKSPPTKRQLLQILSEILSLSKGAFS